MTPANLMTRIDGLMGSGLRAADAPMRQRASDWGKIMRMIVFGNVLRDATDWELGADLDVIDTGANGEIDASGGTVYGFLVDSPTYEALYRIYENFYALQPNQCFKLTGISTNIVVAHTA